MNILCFVLLLWTEPQQIDAVAVNDTLFVSMVKNSDQVWVYRYEGGTPTDSTCLGSNNDVSMAYSESIDGPVILVVSSEPYLKDYSDSLYAVDPSNLDLLWKIGDLPYNQSSGNPEFYSYRLERLHPESRDPRMLGYYSTHVTDASDEEWLISYSFDPDTGPITWEDPLYYYESGGYIDDYFMGPVTVGDEPMVTAIVNDVSTPYYNAWSAAFQVHGDAPDSLLQVLPVGSGQYDYSPSCPRGYCLGSCSSGAVLLWSDTTSTIYSTTVAGSPLGIVSTASFDYSLPEDFMLIDASRNPSDSGLIACYYRDNYIWARYWEDQWCPWEHQVAPASGIQDITTCGTPDGYWIAWKDLSTSPNVAWMDREVLMGTVESEAGPTESVSLTANPSPFTSILNITVSASTPESSIFIYDSSGRRICSGITDGTGNMMWDGSKYPAGVYLIRAVHGAQEGAARVVLIK